ncbi:hypothetical protein MP638_003747 [Amoeboaphelidium occidentale]|nr:hypothetical protein MP638_003747 [Amoeboaphelidium occidentale]
MPVALEQPSSISTLDNLKDKESSHRSDSPFDHGRSTTSTLVLTSSPTAANSLRCNVDYFSFEWDELDLKSSWSLMTKRKKTHTDGLRLENASWRKWWQKRLNLPRIPPEKLRWKKDEDITWLYGPFVKAPVDVSLLEPQSLSSSVNFGHPAKHSIGGISRMRFEHQNSATIPSRSFNSGSSYGGRSAQKPVLKKASAKALRMELMRFSDEAERRISKKFSARSPVTQSQSAPITISNSKSDPLLAKGHSVSYLDQKEIILLNYSNEGPFLNPAVTKDRPGSISEEVASGAVSTHSSNEGFLESSASSSEFVDQQLNSKSSRGKLRFSSEVEVLEYESTEGRRRSVAARRKKKAPFKDNADSVNMDSLSAEISNVYRNDRGAILLPAPDSGYAPVSLEAAHTIETLSPEASSTGSQAPPNSPGWIQTVMEAANWFFPSSPDNGRSAESN